MVKYGKRSRSNARELWVMCSRDLLFYVNTFVWMEAPRRMDIRVVPFNTYEFQDRSLAELMKSTGLSDVASPRDTLIEKSRDLGATWMCMALSDWAWRFRPHTLITVASRKQDLVDKTDNPDTLFAKLDFIENYLPNWLALGPQSRRRQQLSVKNLNNDAVINGESTTGDLARGGRRSFILLDEFASFEEVMPGSGHKALSSTRDTTNCRIMNSTPKGTATAFYSMRMNEHTNVLSLHWSMHPEKRPGLYRVVDGKPDVLDAEWHLANPGYPLETDPGGYDGLRSPWYDGMCRRAGSRVEIAQELDLDYFGAGDPFFDQVVIDELLEAEALQPGWTGKASELVRDLDVNEVYPTPFRVWCNLDASRRPPRATTYSMGCDISTGTGASDSTISVVDNTTGEKVAEYSNNRVLAEDFAKIAVAVAKLFSTEASQCFMGWEATGPGETFGIRVMNIHNYGHVYFYRNETDLKHRRSGKPGWYANRAMKAQLLAAYRSALGTGKFKNRSREALEQCREYVYTHAGSIEHSKQRTNESSSGNKEQHGDMVIADAVASKMLDEWTGGLPGGGLADPVAPMGSMKWRMEQSIEEAREHEMRRWYE